MPRLDRIGRTHTHVFWDDDGWMKVKYHNTILVKFEAEGDMIVLNRGRVRKAKDGRLSVTAKNRINQASNEFGLGFQVFTKDFEWYIKLNNGSVIKYHKGLTFAKGGENGRTNLED